MRRIVVLVLAVALALPLVSPARAASEDVLPDLGMARLTDLRIQKTADGRKLLRFSSIIVNVGDGPFEMLGQRYGTADTMTVTQRVFDKEGGHRDVPTEAEMYFGGDGHNHWHVRDLESFTLERLSNRKKIGTGAKHGFCFFDNYRYGSEENPHYTSCGQSDDLEVTMGLSVGWGDLYRYNLPDQYIDITGLPSGLYRLSGTVDEAREGYPNGWFEEADESNNSTWVDIRIRKGKAKVLGYGPSA